MTKKTVGILAALSALLLAGAWTSQFVGPGGRNVVQLGNALGQLLDVNGTRLRVQDEAAGNGNTPQDVRADSWGDGVSNGIQQVMAYAAAAGWNGSGFDRTRTASIYGGTIGTLLVASNVGSGNFEMNAATTQSAKNGAGILHKLVVGTPVAGTITLYDIGSGGCTGTPGSGKFSLVTLPASSAPVSLAYDLKFSNGLCIQTSAAFDLTAVFE